MKATGIVRRIDDLGRVVIPKEIRRTMRIREGDPLEIFTYKEGVVIFKKYSAMESITEHVLVFAEALAKATGGSAAVCDRDTILAVSGVSKREFGDKPVSDELGRIMQERVNYVCKPGDTKRVPLMNGNDRVSCSVVCPIIAESDCVGALVLILPDSGAVATESEFKLCSTCATVLGMQMEG